MINSLTYLAALLAVVAWLPGGDAAEPLRVRVLTYNIHHGAGNDGTLDLGRIAAVIREATPDVVALQEVDKATRRSQDVDQAAELGRLTGMQAAFGQAMDYGGGQYGVALLSRWPLGDAQVHALPTAPGCEPRCAVAARVRIGGDGPEVLLAATHLEHAQATLRLCQAQKLNAAIAAKHPLPAILAGDFNAVPGTPPIQVLRPHWTDATADRPEPTWPADQPQSKLDYVFFRPAERWRVVEHRVVAERVASDHRPLLVVLQWVPEDAPAGAAEPGAAAARAEPGPGCPPWLTFVPEMGHVQETDFAPVTPDSAAGREQLAEATRGARAEWQQRAAEIQPHVTPQRVRSLSRWALRQMEQYTAVPPLDQIQLAPLGLDEDRRCVILSATVQTLPTHHALVTRWLKVFVRYDPRQQRIAHVTITIRGQVEE